MNWKNRLTNYNFWISIVSAVLLILQAFKFEFDIVNINEIATAVLGLLVVIGIISDPTKASSRQADSSVAQQKESTLSGEEQIPSDQENEADGIFNKDDFKVLIEKISADLKSSLKIDEKLQDNSAQILDNSYECVENEPLKDSVVEDENYSIQAENSIEKDVEFADNVVEDDVQSKLIEVNDDIVEVEVNVLNSVEVETEIKPEEIEINQIQAIDNVQEEKIECYNIVNN